MSDVPIAEDVAAAILKAVDPFRAHLESVMLHGSVVRGDFWPGQSDIDVMVLAKEGATSQPAADALKAVPRYGPMFERHACSIGDVKAELALPFGKRTWTQFAINGFDLKKNHLPVLGADFLKDADVPVGDQLMRIARKRVRGLLDEECVRIPDEMWKWGAEAVKASQIYFTLKRGGAPTRHKREAIANFFANVPVGSKSDFAKIIWENYEAGRHPNDNSYKAECRAFIEELWKVVEANP